MTPMLPALLAATLLSTGLAAATPAADPPQRLVVLFDALPPGLAAHATFAGADVLAVDAPLRFAVAQAAHGNAFQAAARSHAGVRAVEPDHVAEALGLTSNDPQFGKQYAPQLVGAPAAWATATGAGVTICMLDTGLRTTHEDLAARYAGGIDLVNQDNDPTDDGGHGTRTAGVAAATIGNARGIAGIANAAIKEVKVMDAAGRAYSSAIATGIRWCADNGAKVVSMSFGGASPDTAVRDAVDYAWNKGLLLVAGSGNGGCADCVLYPAAYDHVIAVGCVDAARNPCASTSRGPQVDLAAPGSNILTTGYGADNAYIYGGGTSLSAPHVAGAAALVWSTHPDYTNAQVRQALEATAQDVGAAGRDDATGAGLVRADRAVAYGGTPAPTAASAFSATFAPSASVNEWWVDVKVTSASAIASVAATVNGGAPHALAKTSWGTWAASFNVPKGSIVTFTAKDAAGAAATSDAYAWLLPAFTPTFMPKTLTNHWWVEVAVASPTGGVASVAVQLDGGAWTQLPKTTWGTYAKSLPVPAGTHLLFRATSTAGATATSIPYTEA